MIRLAKKQEGVSHIRNKTESIGPSPEMTHMLQLAFLSMVRDLQENMCQMNEQMGSLSGEIETVKKGQMEILKLSRTITEMNSHWIGLTGECRWQTE